MRISKINAAEYQLKEAIRLFFERRDPVSIRTLVSSSHQILCDKLEKNNKKLSVFKQFLGLIRDEKKGEIRNKIRFAQNFFKHADKDSEDVMEYNPEINEIFLFDPDSNFFLFPLHYK